MEKKIIDTQNAPEALGPYSQAVKVGDFLFTSGQIALDPESMELVGDGVQEQAKQVFENLKAVLATAGCTFDDVVKVTVFIDNMDDFAAVNEVYASYFAADYPARSTVEVARLPKDALVEIEMIAKVPAKFAQKL